MKKSSSTKRFFAWLILIVWVGFIYLTLGTVPEWRDILFEKYGESVFTTLTFAGGVIALAIFLFILIFRLRERSLIPYLALFATALAFVYVLKQWVALPVEQIHFIEYGLVGFLCYNALRYHLKGWGLATAAILLTFLLGMVDETIQGLLASRVGQLRDMWWNAIAGAMSLAVVVFSLRPKIIYGSSGHKEIRAHLIMAALCLLNLGYFNREISQFGYLHHDEDFNVTFKSRLTIEKLQQYDDNLDHFKREIAPHVAKKRMVYQLQEVHDLIHEEALVHSFRRAYHFIKGNIRTVYCEDLIIDKYFHQFVHDTDLDWPRSRSAEMKPVVGERIKILYQSPVADHLITSFRQWQMWTVILLLEIVFITLMFKLRGRKHETLL
jgi:hypothetical protein